MSNPLERIEALEQVIIELLERVETLEKTVNADLTPMDQPQFPMISKPVD